MKRIVSLLLGITLILLMAGCRDRINLEDITLALMYGIDLDDNNHLIVYMSSPVFNKDVQKKDEQIKFTTKTLFYSSNQFDSAVTAMTRGGKLQTLLIGKRILDHPGWFKLLDLLYRNPKLSVNSVVAGVDGPLSDIFFYNPKDKPLLMLHIKKLIQTAHRKNITVYTNVLELHRQMYEKGVTPAITLIKKKKEIEIVGTALLDKEGQISSVLSIDDNVLLSILNGKKNNQTFTVKISQNEKKGFYDTNYTSFLIQNPKYKIKTNYSSDQFNYEIRIKLSVIIAERLFAMSAADGEDQLQLLIEEQLNQRFAALIKKFQQNKIDPIGLGLYARAFQYQEWKKVQEHWGKSFSEAKVTVKVKVKIIDSGNVQ